MTPRITDEQVASLDLAEGRAQLLEEIMATPVLDRVHRPDEPRHAPWVSVAAAAAAVTLVVGGAAWLGSRHDPRAVDTPVASGPSSSVEGYRAVLSDPGWRISDLYDPGDGHGGSISYARGPVDVEINWYPADTYASYVQDRQVDLGDPEVLDLLGEASKLWSYDDQDFEAMRPAAQGHFLAIRASGLTRTDFLQLAAGLRLVDEEAFADAVGDSAVTPANADRVVAEILDDVPLPDGFTSPSLGRAYLSRYQAIAEVTGPVSCAWARQYDEGRAGGDQRAVDEATDAMVGSRQWAALREIADQGDWAESLWSMGAAMASGTPGIQERYCADVAVGG